MIGTASIAKSVRQVKVLGTGGKWASPYRIENRVLVKKCDAKHIFRARQSIGIDELVWRQVKDHISIVRFEFPESVREISAEDFERKSFLHGDDITFARTRFVRLADLCLVREAPPARGQLALGLGF